MQKKTKLTSEQALLKIQFYCAYQERCHKEVMDKLYDYGLWKEQVENIIFKLIQENYLNEERFAEAFANDKFKFKQWGKVKIKSKLKEKRVSDYCIKKGLKVINDDEYEETIKLLISKKTKDYTPKYKGYPLKIKLTNFLLSKGFEYELINQELGKLEE